MADTEAQKKVESTVEEDKGEKGDKLVEKQEIEETKVEENGEKTENGESKDKKEPKIEEKEDAPSKDKCCIKRKSAGADAADGKKEEKTPEKKAKLDEAPAEAESNGDVAEAEVAA